MSALMSVLKSKTMWWGLAQVLAAATLGYFQETILPLIQNHPQATLLVTGGVTWLLRTLTKAPLLAK